MSQVFQLCETNFYNSIRTAQKHLSSTNPTEDSISQASEAITEASQELDRMQIQYRIDKQPHIKQKIEVFKDELKNFKRELQKHQRKMEEEVEANSGPLFDSQEQERGVNPLIEAKRMMYQNQAMSNEVAVGIKRNNEVIIKNINKMDDINNQLTVAHKVLDSIKKKMRKNKLIMCGTLAFLVFIVLLIVYSYVKSGGTTIINQNPKPNS